MSETEPSTRLLDLKPSRGQFLFDVVQGLLDRPKNIPCKYLYDKNGSELFEEICDLDEYYPTRTETTILEKNVEEMVGLFQPDTAMIEFGSGSSRKTKILLDSANDLAAYVPVDISERQLKETAEGLRNEYPDLEILPVCADYTKKFELPTERSRVSQRVVYFPGSTIGNFDPVEARDFLSQIAELVENGGGLLIGVDLKKDSETLESAYNDGKGVTAAFNKNLLHRINRELDGDFNVDKFEHLAFYNGDLGRIELHLESLVPQAVHVGGEEIVFEEGETIHTENSYKYNLEEFAFLAARAGMTAEKVWTDPRDLFSVQYLTV